MATQATVSSTPLLVADVSHPNVTAVILNWSRFANVVRIVSLLCGTQLENMIAEIIVWNNSPRKLEQRVGISFYSVRRLADQAVYIT